MSSPRVPKNWWQAGLAWGTAMLVIQTIKAAYDGRLTLGWAARGVVIWEAAGLLFGVLLTGVLSVLFHRNLFRGFADRTGGEV